MLANKLVVVVAVVNWKVRGDRPNAALLCLIYKDVLGQHWVNVGPPLGYGCATVGPTFGYGCATVGPTLAQCWANFGSMLGHR